MGHGHSHAHDHDHDHDHGHGVIDSADAGRRVGFAALLTFAFMIAEVAGGLISGSLALLADAAHMLTDAGSLALAWLGFKLAERPADDQRSYGWARFKILAAFVNGLSLILLAVWITWEAVARLMAPEPVMGNVLMGVAIMGLLVNVVAFWMLHRGDSGDINLQGALWHVAGDLLGSVAAIGAAIVIMTTGWMPIDPLLSILVAVLIFVGGIRVTRKSAHILIEIITEGSANIEAVRVAAKARLADHFGVSHATVEVVSGADAILPDTPHGCTP